MRNKTPFIANNKFKEGRKRGIRKIINLFIGGNIMVFLWPYIYFLKDGYSPLLPIFFIITLLGCNYITYTSIHDNNRILYSLDLSNNILKISTSSIWSNNIKEIILLTSDISVSKGTFNWNGEGDKARGLIIRNKKK